MKKVIYPFLLLTVNIFTMKSQNIELTGKFIMQEPHNNTYIIYNFGKQDTLKINLLNNTERLYSGFSRLYVEDDKFISVEHFKTAKSVGIKSNLVLLNIKGQFIKNLYEANEGEYVGDAYPSINATKLLFTSENEEKGADVLDPFYRPITINVMNLNTTQIIRQIKDFCPSLNFEIKESPWSPDENRFVYSVLADRKVVIVGEEGKVRNTPSNGIYIYDIEKDKHIKILEKGHYAIWSPGGGKIAYLTDDGVWVYDLSSSSSTRIYKPGTYEKLKVIHWTPDGEYLYLVCPKYYLNQKMLYSYNEKLLRASDGKSISFKKLNIGYSWFSWTK